MSPKTILLWISWAVVFASINCQTIDDALYNVFRRLHQIEHSLSNSAHNSNSNSNCNRNEIKISRRNWPSQNPSHQTSKPYPSEGIYQAPDQNRRPEQGYGRPNYEYNGDQLAIDRNFKYSKGKKHRARSNSDKLYPVEMYYPYGEEVAVSKNHNSNRNRNVNKNRNVNVNKNVVSRRSDAKDDNHVALPTTTDEMANVSDETQA